MSRFRKYSGILPLAALLVLPAVVYSCKEPAKEEPVIQPVVSIKTQTVDGEEGSQFMSVTAGGSWTITTSASWLRVEPSTGTGSSGTVVISYDENTDAIRTGTVTLTTAAGTATASITQNKKVEPEPEPSQVRGYGFDTANVTWMEIPETKGDDGLEFFTLNMKIGDVTTRNYSFYWDYDNLVSWWVAYPLCAWNIGSGSRSNEWGLCPLLPESCQPVLYSAYSGFGARGHQIPSADRLYHDANVQTFYGVNMTPQEYNFNGGTWATLENQVRTWARKTGATAGTDTLYVVTGCVVGESSRKAYDNKGKTVAVPEAYFKALLRFKDSESVGHNGYMGCAFWFENANNYSSSISSDMSMSIAELESKIGYKLFVNLENKVGSETCKAIKEETPATVNWWWQ